MSAIRGSCLCGGVKFELTGPLLRPLNCHCTNCRKQHGAAFRGRVRVNVADLRWLEGEALVRFYESSPGFHRGFCSVCGSPVINKSQRPEYGVPLGILDDEPSVRPERHCFVANRAPWFEITDDLPQDAGYPPPG
jgi:hypothetical protein